jgi:aspartyl-tRNA(Asn)/glutamyl-tRNA(Gln) amidotransferase subunit A
MTDHPIHYQTLKELSRGLRKKDLSPEEITEAYLKRIEDCNEELHAFRLLCPERTRAIAKSVETAMGARRNGGPLEGLPYAVKDLFDIAGLPTTAGAKILEGNIAEEDAAVIEKLDREGMVCLGKTNTVQLAYSGIGINHDHGTPKNPWKKEHYVPGGSSSGSAVAVAAGLAPAALGTDTGGSVRIPAALCGITGLKTTVGRVSRAGVYPLSWSMDSVGPLTHTAEDAALLFEAMQGEDERDETTRGRSRRSIPRGLQERLPAGARGLRVAFAETLFFDDVDPEIEGAVRAAGELFRGLGAYVTNMEVPEAEAAWRLNSQGQIIVAEAYTVNRDLVDHHLDDLDPVIAARIVRGKDVLAADYLKSVDEWKHLRRSAEETLKDVDALLVPTTRIPALPAAEIDATSESYAEANMGYLRNTSIGNILNLCALSVPCGFTTKGLPIGLMIYGKPFQEETVLRLGCAFQEATDWHRKTPPLIP